MPAIEATNLRMTFTTKRKAAGIKGSLRALFKYELEDREVKQRIDLLAEAFEIQDLL